MALSSAASTAGLARKIFGIRITPRTPIQVPTNLRPQSGTEHYRLAGYPWLTQDAPATSPFSDVAVGQQHYKEMAWLASRDISTGWNGPGGTSQFRPLQPVTREAMAAFMYRLSATTL
jgi:hypothetical protein